MSDYRDTLRQLQQQADQKTPLENGFSARAIGRIIVQDRPLQWAIALFVMMALMSVVP